jgi:hypothetical protein
MHPLASVAAGVADGVGSAGFPPHPAKIAPKMRIRRTARQDTG